MVLGLFPPVKLMFITVIHNNLQICFCRQSMPDFELISKDKMHKLNTFKDSTDKTFHLYVIADILVLFGRIIYLIL